MPSVLRANLERVRERIARAARSAARRPDEVRLLAVTKSVSAAVTAELARAGQLEFAENRSTALEHKAQVLAGLGLRPRWHMIGHLQRNKARRTLSWARTIHSVDSVRLLEMLERIAAEDERAVEVYLEVKLAGAAARSGFAPLELAAAVEQGARLAHVRLRGLMVMAEPEAGALAGDVRTQARSRATFEHVRELAAGLPSAAFVDSRIELSMGMSSDLEAAIHAGASVVRVGSALFEGLPATAPSDEERA